MRTTRKMSTIFVAAAIALAPFLGSTAAYAAPNATPTDVVVPGGTNTREIVVTLDRANEGIDGVSIRLVGATWTNVSAPLVVPVSTNPNSFTDCGSSGVSTKTAATATNYTCSLLGVDAILKGPANSTVLGATTTFRIAPGAVTFSSSEPSGGYAITAIVSGNNGAPVYATNIPLTPETAAPTPPPGPQPDSDTSSSPAATLAQTGFEGFPLAATALALVVLGAGSAVLARRRRKS